MSTNGTDCCQEDGHNPKVSMARRNRKKFRFSSPDSPIPVEIQDAGELKRFFKSYSEVFVPYRGTDEFTSHSLQSFLISLCDLSPTQGAVIRSKKSFAFGGKIDIVKRLDPVFNLENNSEASSPEKSEFYEFVKLINLFGPGNLKINFREFAQWRLQDLESNGNFYFEIIEAETLGQKMFTVVIHPPNHCLYLATEKGEQRYIAISPIWTLDYLNRKRPDVLPVYPTFTTAKNGVRRSIVHNRTGGIWYGLPGSISSMLSQYQEFQDRDYKSKQTKGKFMGDALIEVEGDNPEHFRNNDEDGEDDTITRIEENYTNKGDDPQSVVMMTRPYGSKQAYVYQFTPNTNESWFKENGALTENDILKSHSWPKRFLGQDAATGISTNIFLDQFEIHSVTTIREMQESAGDVVNNTVLAEAMEFFEREDLSEFGLEYSSPFKFMLQERKDAKDTNNSMGGSQV